MNRNWIQAMPTPEAYWLDRVLYDTQHNPEHMARFQADPAAYCKDMPLSAQRQAELAKPDIGALYLAGTNPYLLRAHCIGLRISEEDYLGALRAAGEAVANG